MTHIAQPNCTITLCGLGAIDVHKQHDTCDDARYVDLDGDGLCEKCRHRAKIMRMLDYTEKHMKKAKIVHMPDVISGLSGPVGVTGPRG
jgi:hypothetical protein